MAKYVFGDLHPVNPTDRRPLILVLYYGLASIFGLQIKFYYFFNWLIIFSSALMLYVIVRRAFPKSEWIASLVALTYLIYPVDHARTWLIMLYIRFWWLVSLGAIWLFMEYMETGNPWIYAGAMAGTVVPLGAYEGQFGIILLASLLIAFLPLSRPVSRRLALIGGVTAIAIAFLIWRAYVQPLLFHIDDAYVEALQFDPAIILDRYQEGFYIFLKGWFDQIQAQLELSRIDLTYWSLVYILVCCTAGIWINSRISLIERLGNGQKISTINNLFLIFLTGAVFWIAGYIPVIALYRPSISGIASRVNSFAIPGAAMMLVSVVSICGTLIANSERLRRFLVSTILLPFILAGIFVQLQVNRENQIAWDTQKRIWNGVFEVIPNIQDQKRIVIIIPGYQQLRPFESFPFLSGWEIEAGAQVLYNNPNIGGNYYYKDIQPVELLYTKNGFRPIPTDKIIPYKKLIFLYYNPQDKTVKLVENLEETLSLPFAINNYNPRENIVPITPSTTEFRWLVE